MPSPHCFPRVIALGLGLLQPSPLPPHARKLNGPLVRSSLGDVKEFRLVPGSDRVVYRADQDSDEVFELYSRSPNPRQPTLRLNPRALVGHQDILADFRVDPTGRRVLYRDIPVTPGWSVPVDGSAPPVRMPAIEGEFSPDGEHLVFKRIFGRGEKSTLSSTRIDAVGEVSLSGSVPANGQVLDYRITADSTHVVLLGDIRVDEVFEVFSVAIDGQGPILPLARPLPVGRDVTAFRLSPDGRWVVFRADLGLDDKFELYRVRFDTTLRERVSPPIPDDRDIDPEFELSADGRHLVFSGDLATPGVHELFSASFDAPSTPLQISPTFLPGGSLQGGLRLSNDGQYAVFRADPAGSGQVELFGARLDGGAPPARLHAALAPGEVIGPFAISPDSTRVVFLLVGGRQELVSVPLDGSALPVRLHPPLVPDGDVLRFELAGARVVYLADQERDEALELFSVPIDASAWPLRLHPSLASGQRVLPDFQVATDGLTLGFVADLVRAGRFELFLSAVDGSSPARLASDPVATRAVPVGDVQAFAAAGERVVYAADEDRDEVVELFSVPRNGSRGPVRLHAPAVAGGDVSTFVVTPDRARVLFSGNIESEGVTELFSARVEGDSPPQRLHGPLVDGGSIRDWCLAPDGSRVAYLADALRPGLVELFSAPPDGGGPILRLDPPIHANFGRASELAFTPDAERIVYTSDKERRDRFELYAVPSDGSGPAVRLSSVTALGGDVLDFRVSPDSAWIVYRADQDTDDVLELYAVPIKGGQAAVKLNPPLQGFEDVIEYGIGAANRVLFTAGLRRARGLYLAPADGNEPLRTILTTDARVLDFWLTPGGTRALFRAKYENAYLHLHSVPLDGSLPIARLDGPIYRFSVFEPLIPDEDTVLYFARTTGPAGTYRARLDGSTPPLHLDASGLPRSLSADGEHLLVHGSIGNANDGVYVVAVDGSAPALRVSDRISTSGHVLAAAFAPGGDILYLARTERSGPSELYVSGDSSIRGRARRCGLDVPFPGLR